MQWALKRGVQLFVLFMVIVAILALAQDLPGRIADWQREAAAVQSTSDALTGSQADFASKAASAAGSADAEIEELRNATANELDAVEADISRRRREADARVLTSSELALAAARGSSDAIITSFRAQYVDIPLLKRSAALIELRRQNLAKIANDRIQRDSLALAVAAYERDRRAFNQRVRERNAWQEAAKAQRRNPLCNSVAVPLVCARVLQIRQRDRELTAERKALEASAAMIAGRNAAMRALTLQRETVEGSADIVREANLALTQMVATLSAEAASRPPNMVRSALRQHGLQAAMLVLLAVLLPVLFALFRYFVLARAVDRTTALRLRAPGEGSVGSPSQTSLQIPIDRGTELLLRSGAQERAVQARADDVLVLDWAIPFTCVAAGLVNLQRFTSAEPDHVTVSAADGDHHHEIALVAVPAGGALVLKPRALLGVLKARGDRLSIQRNWRILSLVSWMTMQFRYLTFEGPCTLIVQGNRGVHVTQASDGRAISGQLVLGFDAGLAYRAVRSASFRPYFLGRARLFDDRFEGAGSYIHQSRPEAAAGGRGLLGRGLKGAGDAVLNAFGV
ncbi:hypothetical protein GCM10010833_12390 [Blastomonas aquatica]|uniref:Uncharacterized protein n=2 Tax=Blastomonas aquatica TaxID=1510276 RepID=A0ABQ1J751_9SPHN|nr:hypothetical protein GCM10010833_12390 [Blastomonas aquatica]